MTNCERCGKERSTRTAFVQGIYYSRICNACLNGVEDTISSNAAGYARRRGYEDNAQDTVQPYDANGKPRVEFFRLYPESAKKIFDAETIAELKRKI